MTDFERFLRTQFSTDGMYKSLWPVSEKHRKEQPSSLASDYGYLKWLEGYLDEADKILLRDGAYKIFLKERTVGDDQASQVDPESSYRELFHTYDQLVNAPPLSCAIENIWQNEGINIVGGLPEHMKTFFLMSVTKALITGHLLWDHFAVKEKAARVLYLIPESSVGPFAHRLKLFKWNENGEDYNLLRCCAPDDERLFVRTLSLGRTPALSDPRLLHAAKGSHVILDTAMRFAQDMDDESSARQVVEFATLLFDLLAAGARSVGGAHHAPKAFSEKSFMDLQGVLRGSGDIGAIVAVAHGVKLIDPESAIVHVENIKARDFQKPRPFQLIGRPYINDEGDFRMFKRPGECGSLADEQPEPPSKRGASEQARSDKAARIALIKSWGADLSAPELREKFAAEGIELSDATIRGYKSQIKKGGKA